MRFATVFVSSNEVFLRTLGLAFPRLYSDVARPENVSPKPRRAH